MDLLDGTIVNVAAPTIHNDLHSSATGLQWILSGYALAFAMVLITGGRLGDIYGRRRLFIIGSLGFVAASVACGLASSPEMLIVCRLAQGSAAALLVPQGLGIIHTVFSSEEQGSAFALFGPVIGLSAMLGPIIGGALISANLFGSGWRLVFFVNLPLGLIAAFGAGVLMPESRSPRRLRLDGTGGLLAALGMGLLVYPLTEGQSHHWPTWTYLMFAASAASFAALVWWNRRVHRGGGDPLVEPSIFEHRAYVAGLSSVIVFFAGLLGTMLVLTLFLQFGEHFTPIHAGLTLAPFAFGSAIGATLAAAVLAPRLGRRALQIGAVVVALAVLWLRHVVSSRGLHVTTGSIIGPELMLGIGIGMGISPLFDFILASVREHEVGSASGVLNAVQQLAGAIGVAGIGTIFFTTLTHGGYALALSRCLLVEMATMPVVIALVQLLPRYAREAETPVRAADAADETAGTHTFVQIANSR
jgi:EmrB/QacA subfamily drug resistance transporter